MKRSAQVVLAVMAATAVGATAYAVMPNDRCDRPQDANRDAQSCRSSRGGGGYYGFGSFSRDGGRTAAPAAGGMTAAVPGPTQHGGFGSSGRAFGAHASHGG